MSGKTWRLGSYVGTQKNKVPCRPPRKRIGWSRLMVRKMRVPNMGEIRVKGVHTVTSKGREYHYHRKTGKRLESRYGTKAFLDEVYALNEAHQKGEDAVLPGTWGAIKQKFLESDAFANLAPRTQSDYRDRILGKLNIDFVPVMDMTPQTMLQLRDAIYKTRGAKQANYTITVVSRVFNWGKPYGYTTVNPCDGIPKIKLKNKPRANRPWLDHEVRAVLREARPELRLLIIILLRTGLRTADAVNIPWTIWNESGFNYRSAKTGTETWIVPTQDMIEEVRNTPRRALTIATNVSGEPWDLGALRSMWGKFKKRLERERLIGEGLTLHGIRHTVGNALADQNVGTADIAKVLGHKSERMAKHYSDRAQRKNASRGAADVIGRIGK